MQPQHWHVQPASTLEPIHQVVGFVRGESAFLVEEGSHVWMVLHNTKPRSLTNTCTPPHGARCTTSNKKSAYICIVCNAIRPNMPSLAATATASASSSSTSSSSSPRLPTPLRRSVSAPASSRASNSFPHAPDAQQPPQRSTSSKWTLPSSSDSDETDGYNSSDASRATCSTANVSPGAGAGAGAGAAAGEAVVEVIDLVSEPSPMRVHQAAPQAAAAPWPRKKHTRPRVEELGTDTYERPMKRNRM